MCTIKRASHTHGAQRDLTSCTQALFVASEIFDFPKECRQRPQKNKDENKCDRPKLVQKEKI